MLLLRLLLLPAVLCPGFAAGGSVDLKIMN
jgi:hypothetical protein